MANPNRNKLQNLSVKYNVEFQPLYTAEALAKGKLDVVHNALINGKKYTCLARYNNADLENLFKSIASGHDRIHAPENTVIFAQNTKTLSINGNNYSIFDIIKDVEFVNMLDMVNENLNYGEEWQVENAKKIRTYLNNGGFSEWLEHRYFIEYGETVDEYAERVGLGD